MSRDSRDKEEQPILRGGWAWAFAAVGLGVCTVLSAGERTGRDYFGIRVVDGQTGRGVPLVELRTVDNVRYYTDSSGLVAFFEPGLMNRSVFFHVKSHGYEYPADGFGFRGKSLETRPGGRAELKLKRTNIAERLYRLTGVGIYRDSVLLGEGCPLREPLLNAQVAGSDSVMCSLFRGRLFWFWGDTSRPSYPLGNFHVSGATSLLPDKGGLDPDRGVDLTYFTDEKGFAAPCAQMPGEGPTWIDALIVLRDSAQKERMFANCVKVRGFLEVYRRGLAEFNPDRQRFEQVTEFEMGRPAYPFGHPYLRTVGGTSYVYFADPYSMLRVRATAEHLKNLAEYEAYSCLKPGAGLDKPALDRGPGGRLRYGWKKNTPVVGQADQKKLIQTRQMKAGEALLQLQDADTGRLIEAHRGSACWNAYRRRWVMITVETGGTSPLGEVWYAEADTPLGPWVYARKVVTHDKYSLYNPLHHPEFDQDGGRVIYFEGTYSDFFSGSPERTPLYDYNQIMYRLDLADERLNLPVAFCQSSEGVGIEPLIRGNGEPRIAAGRIAFFALGRLGPGTVAIHQVRTSGGGCSLVQGGAVPSTTVQGSAPLFYALPADAKASPATSVELWEYLHEDGARRAYATEWRTMPGYRRLDRPLCRVWKSPFEDAIAWE